MSNQKNKHIWIIDDDLAILEATEAVLVAEGYTVESINNPQNIDSYFTKTPSPSLIYLDVLMSGVDGRDVIKLLKHNTVTKDVPVIMLSANMNIESIAHEAHADGFLKKPFDIEDLITLSRRFIP